MVEINLHKAAKRFQYEWVFRNIDHVFPPGSRTALTGNNGSGKSTLLRCIAGQTPLTSGDIDYKLGTASISSANHYQYISISAPYLELPEEFTLLEFLRFHFSFKGYKKGYNLHKVVEAMYLNNALNKQILNFSSGMKQRLKLGICLFSNAKLLLLDEPTTNLDKQGIDWYQETIKTRTEGCTLIVASNEAREYGFCDADLQMQKYKA
ncbi:ABC transporter ATP-binding protein [Pleomorphovibrio marinus]|uniref:ABC transporter ATP-binding protein n=1 Tax=Pleomorphovibrio marinus TaxID=2164132 RepID=UPI000E0C960C|nr:ATP-binding cassette domain-containing protein [Pleomorphovibrio marinus]